MTISANGVRSRDIMLDDNDNECPTRMNLTIPIYSQKNVLKKL